MEEDTAEDGVRTGRLPVVDVGTSELVGGGGGIRSDVVSASGARWGVSASGTEGDAAQILERIIRIERNAATARLSISGNVFFLSLIFPGSRRGYQVCSAITLMGPGRFGRKSRPESHRTCQLGYSGNMFSAPIDQTRDKKLGRLCENRAIL